MTGGRASAAQAAWPVAYTKLMAPRPSDDILGRPWTRTLAEHTGARRLTLLCAPAGYGKTTVLAEVALSAPYPLAWYALDEGDSNPLLLLLGLGHAIGCVAPDVGAAVRRYLVGASHRRSRWRPVADTLINAVAEAIARPLLLVVDDYHIIDDTPAAAVIAYLVDRLPPACHVLIASRVEPRFPLAHLRARGMLRDVSPRELAFETGDVAALMRHMGAEATTSEIDAVMAATKGWPLGVRLLLHDRSRRVAAGGASAMLLSGTPISDVDEFFRVEVLRHVPATVTAFLLRSCLLDQFTLDVLVGGGLAARDEAIQALTYLRSRHLFLETLDAPALLGAQGAPNAPIMWYRYHPLFAESLRRALREREGGEGVVRLRLACAKGCEAVGEIVPAIEHYLQAADGARAAALLEEAGMRLLNAGALSLVDSLLARLPRELQGRPLIALLGGWVALHQGQHGRTLRHLRHVAAGTAAFGQAMTVTVGALGSMGRYEEALRTGRYALRLLDQADSSREPLCGLTASILDHLHRFDEAAPLYGQARRSSHAPSRAFVSVLEAAFHLLPRGRLARARGRRGRVRDLARGRPPEPAVPVLQPPGLHPPRARRGRQGRGGGATLPGVRAAPRPGPRRRLGAHRSGSRRHRPGGPRGGAGASRRG